MILDDVFFFSNDAATTEIYTLSLHDALPISASAGRHHDCFVTLRGVTLDIRNQRELPRALDRRRRSEEYTSELQSRFDLVCRLLLEKKKRIEDRTRSI